MRRRVKDFIILFFFLKNKKNLVIRIINIVELILPEKKRKYTNFYYIIIDCKSLKK